MRTFSCCSTFLCGMYVKEMGGDGGVRDSFVLNFILLLGVILFRIYCTKKIRYISSPRIYTVNCTTVLIPHKLYNDKWGSKNYVLHLQQRYYSIWFNTGFSPCESLNSQDLEASEFWVGSLSNSPVVTRESFWVIPLGPLHHIMWTLICYVHSYPVGEECHNSVVKC